MMGFNKVVPIPKKIAPKSDFYLHICKKSITFAAKIE